MGIRLRRLALTAVTLAVVVAAWLALAPQQLGGSASYAVVQGSSMEPLLHAGDVAVVREQGDYQVGDVVGYHSRQLGTVVLHRIVERADGRLVTKGDNNDSLDSERPVEGDVIGTLAWRVPRVGRLLGGLRDPRAAAIAVGVSSVAVLGFAPERPSRRRATAPAGPRLSTAGLPSRPGSGD